MRRADWRVSAVPELRAILVEEKAAVLAAMLRGVPAADDSEQVRLRLEAAALERAHRRNLGAAEMYWAGSDMAALALDAAADVPDFNPAADLPTPNGFMVLQEALPGLQTWVKDEEGNEYEAELAVDLIGWTTVGAETVIQSFAHGDRVPNPHRFFEPVWFHRGPADALYPLDTEEAVPRTVRLMSFLAAAALLMASPGVADRAVLTPKTKAARKDAKRGRSQHVTVISLHAPKHVDTEPAGDGAEGGRTYTHRWLVLGHWRNQPHGPGRSKRSVRWIPSYIKGAAGAPLKETERVWAWRR
ncbi:hypothetical protein GCM10027449_26450 [Sinomonas notoginsengisoli]|uniref:hypothetical protein n=1 Tax=Sinomonas notoginsengisoli TaxID=1457311 RepID=UPI001F1EC74F|nr:hypothetical protein [Sinomonas notoginsengisoli]